MPPAVGGGGAPCLRIVRATGGRTAHPMRLTCSVPRWGLTKNTPQPSRSSCARGTSPLAKVTMNLSYSQEIENVSGTCSGSASGTARKAPVAAVLSGIFPSAFMNQ